VIEKLPYNGVVVGEGASIPLNFSLLANFLPKIQNLVLEVPHVTDVRRISS